MKIQTIYRTNIGEAGLVFIDRDLDILSSDELIVQGKLCGFCKSDVDTIFKRNNVSVEIFGHEGVGKVVDAGSDCVNFIGKYVATYGDGCYGDYYKVSVDKVAIINEPTANYIVQPLATMLNVLFFVSKKSLPLIHGSGSNAVLLGKLLFQAKQKFYFVGSHNIALLSSLGGTRINNGCNSVFDTVVEISGKQGAYSDVLLYLSDEGFLIGAANPKDKELIDLFTYSWKALNLVFPSPRNKQFRFQFLIAADLLNSGCISMEDVFERGYGRDELQQLIIDTITYKIVKGYIRW